MTASVESIADGIVAAPIARDWLYSPSPAPGVLDFTVDGLTFRIVIIDEAETVEGVAVFRSTDVSDEEAEAFINGMTPEEAAQVSKAQALAAEAEATGNFGPAQAAEFESPEQTPLGHEREDA